MVSKHLKVSILTALTLTNVIAAEKRVAIAKAAALPVHSTIRTLDPEGGSRQWSRLGKPGRRFMAATRTTRAGGFFADNQGNLFVHDGNGKETSISSPEPGTAIISLVAAEGDKSNLLAQSATGNVYATETGGETWVLVKRLNGQPVGGAFPMESDPLNPRAFFIADTGLWRTTDLGASWEEIVGLPNGNLRITAIAVSLTDPQVVGVGREAGSVALANLGSGNVTVAYPREGLPVTIAMHPARPAAACVGYHNTIDDSGNIFCTGNGGEEWTAAGLNNPGYPDAPVNGLRLSGENGSILYAATDLGLLVSLDTGVTWAREDLDLGGEAALSVTEYANSNGYAMQVATARGAMAVVSTPAAFCEFQFFDPHGNLGNPNVWTKENWMDMSSVGWSGQRVLKLVNKSKGMDARSCNANMYLPPKIGTPREDPAFWYDAKWCKKGVCGFMDRFQSISRLAYNTNESVHLFEIGIHANTKPHFVQRGIFVDKPQASRGYDGFVVAISEAAEGYNHCQVSTQKVRKSNCLDYDPAHGSRIHWFYSDHGRGGCVNISTLVVCGTPVQLGLKPPPLPDQVCSQTGTRALTAPLSLFEAASISKPRDVDSTATCSMDASEDSQEQ